MATGAISAVSEKRKVNLIERALSELSKGCHWIVIGVERRAWVGHQSGEPDFRIEPRPKQESFGAKEGLLR